MSDLDAAAKEIARTLMYAWDGLRENTPDGFPEWGVGRAANPSQDAFRKLAARVIAASMKIQPETPAPSGQWKCPINYQGCTQNCGNYGCGN